MSQQLDKFLEQTCVIFQITTYLFDTCLILCLIHENILNVYSGTDDTAQSFHPIHCQFAKHNLVTQDQRKKTWIFGSQKYHSIEQLIQ